MLRKGRTASAVPDADGGAGRPIAAVRDYGDGADHGYQEDPRNHPFALAGRPAREWWAARAFVAAR